MLEPNSKERFDQQKALPGLKSPDLATESKSSSKPGKTVINIVLAVVAVLSTLITIWIWVENSRLSQRLKTETSNLTTSSAKKQPP
ncbi:MAG: hypothetical protein ACRCU2_16170, partial [Planktothrix sp.]